jgi:hypothetical protein
VGQVARDSQPAGPRHALRYNALFSIVQQLDESLQTVAGCASEALACVQELRPESFTIAMLDNKLAIMAMLRAPPHKHYGEFVSALMRQKCQL